MLAREAAATSYDPLAELRERTHRCERYLGLPETPVSTEPIRSDSYRRWVYRLWKIRADTTCRLAKAAGRSVFVAARVAFGPYAEQAVSVSWCESRFDTNARNGQYLGLWQMGEWERATYGHGDEPIEQARAAARYFFATHRTWSPWSCKPRTWEVATLA